jgi:hypothetical protein
MGQVWCRERKQARTGSRHNDGWRSDRVEAKRRAQGAKFHESEGHDLSGSRGGWQNAEPEPDPDAVTKAALGGKKILCRVCQGDHFTSKCPYKETLGLPGGI